MNPWVTLFWIFGGVACLLFAMQSIFWTSMRLKKLTVPRWTVFARRMRFVALMLLATGGLIFAIGPAESKLAAGWAVFGGGFNALIATFHLLTIAYLTGGKSGGLIDGKRARRPRPPEVDASNEEQPASVD